MIILAIETSCDDTCIAVIELTSKKNTRFNILSNIISSQVEIHKKYGGVWPTLAKREHQRNLVPVLEQSLKEAKLLDKSQKSNLKSQIYISKFKTLEKILLREKNLFKELKKFLKKYQKPKIDSIAITNGPGLEPCLWTGVNFAKALACFWDLPIVPVNHIEAHILVNFINKFQVSSFKFQDLFPAICLVVSGGHTQLILMENFGKYKILGETRDDAAGECFDKIARILGLGYPGGPAIAAKAAKLQTINSSTLSSEPKGYKLLTKLPRPMIYSKDYDFSFSGLKTAVLYDYKKQPPKIKKSQKYLGWMAKEIQQAIIDVLIKKTIKAAKNFKAKTIILGGGVAANEELRKQFFENCKLKIENCLFLVPPKNFCTDNAAMAAIAGYYAKLRGETEKWQKIKAEANLRIK